MAIAAKNNVLSQFGIDYVSRSGLFLHDAVSPVVRVKGRTFRYKTLAASNLSRDSYVRTSAAGNTLQSDITTTNTAAVIDYELRNKILVTWADGDEHPDGMDGAKQDAAAITMHRVHLEAEIALNTALATLTQTAAAGGGGGWAGGAAVPMTDLKTAFNTVRSGSYGLHADTIIMPFLSYQTFTLNSDVQAFVKGTVSGDNMTPAEVEAALSRLNGAPIKLYIAAGMYDVSGTATDVWTGTAGSGVVYVLRQEPGMGSTSMIRSCTTFGVDHEEGVFDAMETTDPARPKGEEVEAVLVRKPIITANGAGYKLTAV